MRFPGSLRQLLRNIMFVLVLGLCRCTGSLPPTAPISTATMTPTFSNLLLAETINMKDDWTGLSKAAPLEAHYTLKLGDASYTGKANFSAGGYSGKPLTATADIEIPLNVAKQFLQMLSEVPLETGEYKPVFDHTDDYPTITIEIVTPDQTATFFSTSQGTGNSPWQVTVQTGDKAVKYVSNSTIPSDALKLIAPLLKRDVLDALIKQIQSKG